MDAQHQTRSCIRERGEVSQTAPRGSRQICIPMDKEKYDAIWGDAIQVREYLDQTIADYPELFPNSIANGYLLRGLLPESRKLPGIRLRQIKTASGVFTLRPSFLFPYMMGTTDELEKPLFLLSIGTPLWAVTQVFGRNDMFWQRHLERLGRNSLAGTTVRVPERMPLHLAADEHHLDWCGQKGFLAMTAAGGCTLGAALTQAADEKHLTEAYGVFEKESRNLAPNWQPKTANTDGWKATRAAFAGLFPRIVLILCFLHGFLKIRDRCRKHHDLHERIWNVYHAESAAEFNSQMVDLKSWSETADLRAPVQETLNKLFAHEADYAASYAHPDCYRTSNQVDRPMNRICRSLYASRGLHGHQQSSERRLRGLCLLNNFRPFAPRSNCDREYPSPAQQLSHRTYHKNWLHNLLASASLQGFRLQT